MDYKLNNRKWRHLLVMPFIYILLVPLVILDVFIEIYHHICFPLCGLPLMKRWEYIKVDRHKLKYLRWTQKIGCAYCGYANGFAHYVKDMAGITEKYWCGIQHAKMKGFKEQEHQKDFVEYGDEKALKKRYP